MKELKRERILRLHARNKRSLSTTCIHGRHTNQRRQNTTVYDCSVKQRTKIGDLEREMRAQVHNNIAWNSLKKEDKWNKRNTIHNSRRLSSRSVSWRDDSVMDRLRWRHRQILHSQYHDGNLSNVQTKQSRFRHYLDDGPGDNTISHWPENRQLPWWSKFWSQLNLL